MYLSPLMLLLALALVAVCLALAHRGGRIEGAKQERERLGRLRGLRPMDFE